MLVLSIRTDKNEAELALFNDYQKLEETIWESNRILADTLIVKIKELLTKKGKEFQDIEAIAVYKGPGSFTGLRIGLTLANTFAYSLKVPIIGKSGENWQKAALKSILNGKNQDLIVPYYGGDVKISLPKK